VSTKDLRDLFVYEAGLAISAERSGSSMLGELAYRVKDRGLAELMQDKEKHRRECVAKFESCFEAIGGTPIDVLAPSVEALRTRFKDYTALNRPHGMVDLFILGTSLRFMYFMITVYKELINLSENLGEDRCKQGFQDLLGHKEYYIERFERYGRRMVESASAADRFQ
jgi:ferritin-like metal-binding protein YciE